jgi:hypothetical protein
VSRWISPQAAFNRLLPLYNGNGWAVGESLEGAMRRNDLRLRCNGAVLNRADIRDGELYVHVDMARDGYWTCTIASRLPPRVQILEVDDDHEVQMVRVAYPPPPKWEVDEEGIEALASGGSQTRGRHGPEWRVQAEEEIQRLARIHSSLLENYGELYAHVEGHLKRKGISVPVNKQRFRKEIRGFCSKHR